MADVDIRRIVSMGTLQNLVRAMTIPSGAMAASAAAVPGGAATAISDPLLRWAALLDQHVGTVEGDLPGSAEAVKGAALALAGTAKPGLDAVQRSDAQALRSYADAARAFLQAVDPILADMEGRPDLMQETLERGVGGLADGLSPTLQGVQNVYAQSVRSFAQALKLVAGAVPAMAAGQANAVVPGTAATSEKIDIT